MLFHWPFLILVLHVTRAITATSPMKVRPSRVSNQALPEYVLPSSSSNYHSSDTTPKPPHQHHRSQRILPLRHPWDTHHPYFPQVPSRRAPSPQGPLYLRQRRPFRNRSADNLHPRRRSNPEWLCSILSRTRYHCRRGSGSLSSETDIWDHEQCVAGARVVYGGAWVFRVRF